MCCFVYDRLTKNSAYLPIFTRIYIYMIFGLDIWSGFCLYRLQ